MQHKPEEKSHQKNQKAWYMGSITFFSLLMFIAIGMITLTQMDIKNFYHNKLIELNSSSIEAIIPTDANQDKILGFLGDNYEQIIKRNALSIDGIQVDMKNSVTTSLVVLDISKNDVHLSSKSISSKEGIVLPYALHITSGLKQNDKITIHVGEELIEYKIVGFYEDEILSHQESNEVLVVYLDSVAYEELEQLNEVQQKTICSIYLKDDTSSDEVLAAWLDDLQQQLFIGGIEIDIFNGQDLAENATHYMQYVTQSCFILGIVFFLVSAIGIVSMVHNSIRNTQMEIRKLRIGCYACQGIAYFVGILLLVFGGSKVISYMISSVGYSFSIHSNLMFLFVVTIIYVLIEVMLFELTIKFHHKNEVETVYTAQPRGIITICKKGITVVFLVSTILITIALVVTRVYSNTVGNQDLFYQYNETEEVVEVFHSSTSEIEEQQPFTQLTEYAKPLVDFLFIGCLLALGMIYALVISLYTDYVVVQLRKQGEVNIRAKVFSILGIVLAATLLAYLVGMFLAQLCMGPVMRFLYHVVGLSLDRIGMNLSLSIILVGFLVFIGSGITVLQVK